MDSQEHKLINQNLKNGKFIKIRTQSKAPDVPKGVDWNTQKVDYDEANKLISLGYNIGLVADENILIVDADTPESVEYCDKELPMTLTEKTCSNGKHYFYIPMGDIKNTTIGKNKGEIRANREYVVIAPSQAPSKLPESLGQIKSYTVVRDMPLATITQEEINRLVNFFSSANLNLNPQQLIQKEVDCNFISTHIFNDLSPYVKDLIVKKKTKEDLQLLGYPSRSERDMKIVSHMLNKGFGEYIFSLFKLYPCGDKFKAHPSPEKYLNKTIESAIDYLGIRTKGDMDLENQIEDSPTIWLKRHLDEILLKISLVVDNTNLFKESLISTLAFRTRMSQVKLEKRLKELIEESKPREMISMMDLCHMEVKPQEYWVDPLLPKGSIIILGAKPGVGKSLFIQALSTSILTTGQFLDYPCQGAPKIILYSVDDSSQTMLHQRHDYLLKGLKLNPKYSQTKLVNCHTSFIFNNLQSTILNIH